MIFAKKIGGFGGPILLSTVMSLVFITIFMKDLGRPLNKIAIKWVNKKAFSSTSKYTENACS